MIERKIYFLVAIVFFLVFATIGFSNFHGKFWILGSLIAIYPFIMNRTRDGFLPVLMYHSVSDSYEKYPVSHLSISRRNFKLAMWYLHFRGYHTLTLNEVYRFSIGKDIPRKSIVLTFDDGFLDNWVNAYSILEHYNLNGAIFVTYDFIVKDDRVRKNRPFYNDDQKIEEEWGYLSIGEIKKMYESHVFEFYPHGKTHTWYFKSDKVVDFHFKGDPYYWLDWNNRPSIKPFWIQFWPQSNVDAGSPVFEYGKSLEIRRFLPENSLIQEFVNRVQRYKCLPSKSELMTEWKKFREEYPAIGRYESDHEYEKRIWDELVFTRDFLEKILGQKSFFFCWPGGGKDDFSIKIAYEKVGYLMTTTHQYSEPNRKGNRSQYIYRVSGGYSMIFENRIWNLLKFMSHVETYRRNYTWIWLFGIIDITEMLLRKLGKTRRKKDFKFNRISDQCRIIQA